MPTSLKVAASEPHRLGLNIAEASRQQNLKPVERRILVRERAKADNTSPKRPRLRQPYKPPRQRSVGRITAVHPVLGSGSICKAASNEEIEEITVSADELVGFEEGDVVSFHLSAGPQLLSWTATELEAEEESALDTTDCGPPQLGRSTGHRHAENDQGSHCDLSDERYVLTRRAEEALGASDITITQLDQTLKYFEAALKHSIAAQNLEVKAGARKRRATEELSVAVEDMDEASLKIALARAQLCGSAEGSTEEAENVLRRITAISGLAAAICSKDEKALEAAIAEAVQAGVQESSVKEAQDELKLLHASRDLADAVAHANRQVLESALANASAVGLQRKYLRRAQATLHKLIVLEELEISVHNAEEDTLRSAIRNASKVGAQSGAIQDAEALLHTITATRELEEALENDCSEVIQKAICRAFETGVDDVGLLELALEVARAKVPTEGWIRSAEVALERVVGTKGIIDAVAEKDGKFNDVALQAAISIAEECDVQPKVLRYGRAKLKMWETSRKLRAAEELFEHLTSTGVAGDADAVALRRASLEAVEAKAAFEATKDCAERRRFASMTGCRLALHEVDAASPTRSASTAKRSHAVRVGTDVCLDAAAELSDLRQQKQNAVLAEDFERAAALKLRQRELELRVAEAISEDQKVAMDPVSPAPDDDMAWRREERSVSPEI